MATVDISNWDEKNTASVGNLSDSSSFSGLQKVQPVKISYNVSSPGSGTGDAEFSKDLDANNSTDADYQKSIVVTESDEATTRPYEVAFIDTAAEVIWIWVYGSWDSDDGDQIVVAVGGGDGTDYSSPRNASGTNGSGSNPWGQTGVNASVVYHLNNLDSDAGTNDSVFDSSPNGFNMTADGAVSSSGTLGNAADFDGTDDEIDVDEETVAEGNSEIEVVVLFNVDSDTGSKQHLISKFGNNDVFNLRHKDSLGTWGWRIDTDAGRETANPSFGGSTGSWYLLHCTWTGSELKVYRDASQEGSGTSTSGTSISSYSDSDNLTLGKQSGGLEPFDGKEDHVRVHSDSKSESYRQAGYDATPEGGQVFFSWGGATSTGATLKGNVKVDGSNQQNVDIIVYNKSTSSFEGITQTDSNSDWSLNVNSGTDNFLVGYFYDDGTTFYASGERTNPT